MMFLPSTAITRLPFQHHIPDSDGIVEPFSGLEIFLDACVDPFLKSLNGYNGEHAAVLSDNLDPYGLRRRRPVCKGWSYCQCCHDGDNDSDEYLMIKSSFLFVYDV